MELHIVVLALGKTTFLIKHFEDYDQYEHDDGGDDANDEDYDDDEDMNINMILMTKMMKR